MSDAGEPAMSVFADPRTDLLLGAWAESGYAVSQCNVARCTDNLENSYALQPDFRAFAVLAVHALHVICPARELGLCASSPIYHAMRRSRRLVCEAIERVPSSLAPTHASVPPAASTHAVMLMATIFWHMGHEAMLRLFAAAAFAGVHLQPAYAPESVSSIPTDLRAPTAIALVCSQLATLKLLDDLPPLEGGTHNDWWLWHFDAGCRGYQFDYKRAYQRVLRCHGMRSDRDQVRTRPPNGNTICECQRLRQALLPYMWTIKARACMRLDHPVTGRRFARMRDKVVNEGCVVD